MDLPLDSKPPDSNDASQWRGVYDSAIRYGRVQGYADGYADGYRTGYAAGEAAATATDEQFADLVAERTIARYLNGEEISANIRATLTAMKAQKARKPL